MEAITPTCDRKTKFWNAQKNTFGTMPGPDQTCPGATIGEGGCWTRPGGRKTHTCYVDAVLLCYKAVGPVLAKNTKVLKQATQTEMFDILCREFSRFQKAEFGRFDRTGEMPQLYYRLHRKAAWNGI